MICIGRAHVSKVSPSQRGFTLLEVVIALALSLILLTALLIALDLFRRVSTMSNEEIKRGQLARAIFRQIEIDLRSCTYHPPQTAATGGSSSSGGGGSSGSSGSTTGSSDSQTAATTIDPTAVYATAAGVVGDSTSIVIQSIRPARNLASLIDPAVAETAVPESDLRTVVYFLSATGREGLAGAAASALAGPVNGDGVGLARIEGDQLAMQFADSTADVASMASGATLLAQEVTVLTFRYFDGISWCDVWDTAANARLPNAVEITIGFGVSQAPDDAASTASSGEVTPVYTARHIIALPSAEPPVLYAGASPL